MTARSRHVCPICGKESRPRSDNPSYPFCSPPCKLVDLGAWLDGAYRIPDPDGPLDSEHEDRRAGDHESDARPRSTSREDDT